MPYAARGVRWTEAKRRATDRLMRPCVSIVLPKYNGADYFGEPIRSCLQQAFSDLELVVVVDGSVDNRGFDHAQGRYWAWTVLARSCQLGFGHATP